MHQSGSSEDSSQVRHACQLFGGPLRRAPDLCGGGAHAGRLLLDSEALQEREATTLNRRSSLKLELKPVLMGWSCAEDIVAP